jgi:tetratricopeptide (TPR) repeat protein
MVPSSTLAAAATAMAMALAILVAAQSDAPVRRELLRAVSHQKERKWEQAERGYREVLAARPDLVAARIYLAETLSLSGREDEARHELRTAIRDAPGSLLPRLLLVRLGGESADDLSHLFAVPAKRDAFVRMCLLEGEPFVPIERPALVLASMGAIEPALSDYRVAAEIDPWNVDLHRQMGNVLFKASRNREAAEAFERVVSLEPGDAASWGQLGSTDLRLMWWEPAIEALEKAESLSGAQPAGLLALGYAYERKPDFEKALSLYRRAAELAPRWAQARYRAGRALIKLDRLDDAETELARALELDPKMPEAACFLGSVLLEKKDLSAATAELERAVALRPGYAKAHFYLGQAYLRAGRGEDARSEMATYQRLMAEPGNVEPQ